VITKWINEPIVVHINKDAVPAAFIWRRRLYRITDIINWWRVPGAWWNGEDIKLFLQVAAVHKNLGYYELRSSDGEWFLHGVLD